MAVLDEIIARAEARGEVVRTALDMDALMEACVGPFLMRSLIPQSPPIGQGEIERTVTLACLLIEQARQAAGEAPAAPQPATPPHSGGRIRPHG